jgi:hypothetical protein
MKDPLIRTWRVYLAGQSRRKFIKVRSEYWRIDSGAAVFRTSNSAGYPTNVHTFAAGIWSDVCEHIVGEKA